MWPRPTTSQWAETQNTISRGIIFDVAYTTYLITILQRHRHIFSILRHLRYRWPWISLRDHLRSLIFAPVESTYRTSYWTSIVTLVLSCRISVIYGKRTPRLTMKLLSKNRFDHHDTSTLDRQTTCRGNTALCVASRRRAVKIPSLTAHGVTEMLIMPMPIAWFMQYLNRTK